MSRKQICTTRTSQTNAPNRENGKSRTTHARTHARAHTHTHTHTHTHIHTELHQQLAVGPRGDARAGAAVAAACYRDRQMYAGTAPRRRHGQLETPGLLQGRRFQSHIWCWSVIKMLHFSGERRSPACLANGERSGRPAYCTPC